MPVSEDSRLMWNEQNDEDHDAMMATLFASAERMSAESAAHPEWGPDYQLTLDDVAALHGQYGMPDYKTSYDALALLAREVQRLKVHNA